jgi:diphthamide synthase (EF-2-diphthine--ammonia ligase)
VNGASPEPVALSWSGGKDSALALRALREELGTEPVALLTTITEDYDRISMHAVRRELLRAQARATGIELVEIPIPAGCVNATYEERMELAHTSPPLDQVPTIAFGDLFLEDVRAYRETRLAGVGRSFDEALLADLPAAVDPCGENGEFHTFVHASPVFEVPIEIELGESVIRDGFAFQDLLLQ